MMWVLTVLLLNLAMASLDAATPGTPYRLSLTVHSPKGLSARPENTSAQKLMMANLDEYERIIDGYTYADVVVFPEYGVTTLEASTNRSFALSVAQIVPKPFDLEVPCEDGTTQNFTSTYAMFRLSCMAKAKRVFIVVNVIEQETCVDDCRPDNVNLYSTSVAFDRQGMLIASYRKTHLYGEPALDKSAVMFVSSFQTDMDITFGIMTSADLLFAEPTQSFLGGFYVYDYLVPMAFKGQLPFLTPMQIHHGWFESHKNERRVELSLAANQLTDVENGYSGVGVYHSQTQIWQEIANNDTTWTHVVQMNSEPTSAKIGDGRDLVFDQDDLSDYNSAPLLPFTGQLETVKLCHGLFCCSMAYKVFEYTDTFLYQFLVYDGPKVNAEGDVWNVQVCAVVACADSTLESCTAPSTAANYTQSTYFEVLEVEGNYVSSTYNVIPTTLMSNYLTFKNYEFTKTALGAPGVVKIKSIANALGIGSIHTFGLYHIVE